MGKIGDLWVKLGLKKDEFSKGMKEAGNETNAFAGKMKGMAQAAKVAWAAVAAAVVKFATDAVKMTQRWGDAWNQTMAGVKGAYSSFVRQISSGDGWNNLFANMREAYRVSKEVAAALDEIFERKTSFSYQEADTDRRIAQLQLIARDSSRSEQERIDANKEIIRLTNELGDSKKRIYTDEAAQQRRLFQLHTGLNDEQTDFLVKEYNQNREVIRQAREYLQTKKELSKVGGGGDFYTGSVGPIPQPVAKQDFQSPELKKLEEETPQYIKDIAELTRKYDKANDELVKGMADAEVAVIRVDTETMHAQTRATALLGTLSKAGTAGGLQIDMETPMQRAMDNMEDELERSMDKIDQELDRMEPVKFEPLEIVPPDMTEWNEFYNKWTADHERMQELLAAFRDAAIQGFSDAVQELADQFAGLSEIKPGKVVQALLTPLADLAVKEGEILIAQGIGVEACKEALESLNGWAAIAAGTALVAIGAAAKSGLKALAGSGARSTATTSYGGSSSTGDVQTIQTEMTVYVTGRISGNDILISGKKTQDNLNR